MLTFAPRFDRPPRLLFLGAHSDDIEIGCGATALRLASEHPDAAVCWVIFGATGERRREALASAADFLVGVTQPDVRTFDFPDAHFPTHAGEIKRAFEALKRFEPDLVLTHCGHDLHQDHRLVSELTWNTFRDHLVLEYEVPKYDGDLRSPNVFIPVTPELCRRKAALLTRHFVTQRARHWFDGELFLGLLRIRGAECRSPTGYAEGFYGRKVVLGPSIEAPRTERPR
jgi:LmbE family N-acetylglucosaminyl deacetylase